MCGDEVPTACLAADVLGAVRVKRRKRGLDKDEGPGSELRRGRPSCVGLLLFVLEPRDEQLLCSLGGLQVVLEHGAEELHQSSSSSAKASCT